MSTQQTPALLTDKISAAGDLIQSAGKAAEGHGTGPDFQRLFPDLVALRETVESATRTAVALARSEGASWAQVGQMLGITPQGAHKRFSA